MHVRRLLLPLALLFALTGAAGAQALPTVKGGSWHTEYITEPDGTELHAAVLRPDGLAPGEKTPVIMTVSVYDNASGEFGAGGPVEGIGYDPVGPSTGATANYLDFIAEARLMAEHYTYAIVDLRGTGGSSGCQDWAGPGEQADVVAAVKWAHEATWSNGHVGIYGKSYDGVTGLIGTAARPAGLDAVVSMEPVYDGYRYLYGDGMRRANFAGTPGIYAVISVSPGPIADAQDDQGHYLINSVNDTQRPGCAPLNALDQAGNEDHYSSYWRARDIIAREKGSKVPLLLTQGMTEDNTAPDGTAEFLQARDPGAFTRAWLGPWNHTRGNQVNAQKKLMIGRPGWFDEVFALYDRFLRGDANAATYPNFAVQTNDGNWRTEEQWPPADAASFTSNLRPGTYTDTANSTKTDNTGIWTVSRPLAATTILSGAPVANLDVQAALPRANLVVDVYDIGPDGKGPLVSHQGHLIYANGPLRLALMSADWKFAKGDRIGIRVTDNNSEWWGDAVGTQQAVNVVGATITLPFLTQPRPTGTLPGHTRSDALSAYLAEKATLPTGTPTSDFALPPGA
jgi:predicted acyl esterase